MNIVKYISIFRKNEGVEICKTNINECELHRVK